MSAADQGWTFVGKDTALEALERAPRGEVSVDRARSVGFDGARDVLVEGDNLEALKLLAPAYRGQVQMIYIDPPYNTGNDFVFEDDFKAPSSRARAGDSPFATHRQRIQRHHARWSAMMYPRLAAARELLREDGVIFISIDDNEVHHLRCLMDEIYGPDNFVAQITLISNRGGRDYKKVAVTHEYLLCYGRSDATRIREVPKEDPGFRHADSRGPYQLRELRNRNPRFHPGNRPNLFYPVHVAPDRVDEHGCCAVSLESGGAFRETTEPRNSRGEPSVWRWGKEKFLANLVGDDPEASEVVARRRPDGVFNVYEKFRKSTTRIKSVWDDANMRSERGTREVRELFGEAVFDHPKPVELIRQCLQIGTDPDGLVLDFFAGSGTTAQAVHEANAADGGTRRALMVQLPRELPEGSAARRMGMRTISDVARERVLRVQGRAGSDGSGLRVFRVEGEGDAWGEALAQGVRLDDDLPGQ